ncbi:MAG: hypothetical protein O3A87_01405 [Verrucomicrobia bacterium]|nr:hypothetical protein [Verrucomicrobiota bacterium]MDA1005126.1 hypothetical protein [Verrucomicrobiota bacterium]
MPARKSAKNAPPEFGREELNARQGKVFPVNASQVFEKDDPKRFIPDAGIQRRADTLIGWKEEENPSRKEIGVNA